MEIHSESWVLWPDWGRKNQSRDLRLKLPPSILPLQIRFLQHDIAVGISNKHITSLSSLKLPVALVNFSQWHQDLRNGYPLYIKSLISPKHLPIFIFKVARIVTQNIHRGSEPGPHVEWFKGTLGLKARFHYHSLSSEGLHYKSYGAVYLVLSKQPIISNL